MYLVLSRIWLKTSVLLCYQTGKVLGARISIKTQSRLLILVIDEGVSDDACLTNAKSFMN